MYVVVPAPLSGTTLTCPGGMKQTVNGVARCIYPCKPGDAPDSGCYHATCPEGEQWDYLHGECSAATGRHIYPCGPGQVPVAMPDGPSCFISPCPEGQVRDAVHGRCIPRSCPQGQILDDVLGKCVPSHAPASTSPWLKVVAVVAAIGVVGGLAWYSTRGPGSAKPNRRKSSRSFRANHVPPGWAGSKRAPSADDWVVVWIFENGSTSEGRFERYVSQDEIVEWSRPLLKSGLASVMLTRPKDRSVVWVWKAPKGLAVGSAR